MYPQRTPKERLDMREIELEYGRSVQCASSSDGNVMFKLCGIS